MLSFGRRLRTALGLVLLSALGLGCSRDEGAGRAATEAPVVQRATALSADAWLLRWEHDVAFHAGGDESRARGPAAVAFLPAGGFAVLDNAGLTSRVLEVKPNGAIAVRVHEAPGDADDLAVSKQGELALRRAVAQRVDVFDAKGRASGSVSIPASAYEASHVHLLSQGRVMLEHGYQLRYLLGSPNVPREPELVAATPRAGVNSDFSALGYAVELDGDGQERRHGAVTLFELSPGEDGRTERRALLRLGEANAARIFGVVGRQLCAVLEHVDLQAPTVATSREVACVDLDSREVVTTAIETSSLYTPRHDLVFDGKRVGQALPTAEGLVLRTFAARKAVQP